LRVQYRPAAEAAGRPVRVADGPALGAAHPDHAAGPFPVVILTRSPDARADLRACRTTCPATSPAHRRPRAKITCCVRGTRHSSRNHFAWPHRKAYEAIARSVAVQTARSRRRSAEVAMRRKRTTRSGLLGPSDMTRSVLERKASPAIAAYPSQ